MSWPMKYCCKDTCVASLLMRKWQAFTFGCDATQDLMLSGIILPNVYLFCLAGRPLDDGWASGVVPCTENATPAQMQIAGLVELLGSIE